VKNDYAIMARSRSEKQSGLGLIARIQIQIDAILVAMA